MQGLIQCLGHLAAGSAAGSAALVRVIVSGDPAGRIGCRCRVTRRGPASVSSHRQEHADTGTDEVVRTGSPSGRRVRARSVLCLSGGPEAPAPRGEGAGPSPGAAHRGVETIIFRVEPAHPSQ